MNGNLEAQGQYRPFQGDASAQKAGNSPVYLFEQACIRGQYAFCMSVARKRASSVGRLTARRNIPLFVPQCVPVHFAGTQSWWSISGLVYKSWFGYDKEPSFFSLTMGFLFCPNAIEYDRGFACVHPLSLALKCHLMNLYLHNKKHAHTLGTNISASKLFKGAICHHSPETNNIMKQDFKSSPQTSPRTPGTSKRCLMLSNNR